MKFKMIALILALTVLSWAQTATQNSPASSAAAAQSAQDDAKVSCPCCKKMAESTDAKSCCARHEDGKSGEAMACCKGKDAKACMNGDKANAAACQGGKCCGAQGEKDCCAKCAEEKTTMACCGGHCGMDHHEHVAKN